jgi:hypothetical protein
LLNEIAKLLYFLRYNLHIGANPTIAIYNASAVKIYNATSSLVRFEDTNILFFIEKTLNSEVVGLAPGYLTLLNPRIKSQTVRCNTTRNFCPQLQG